MQNNDKIYKNLYKISFFLVLFMPMALLLRSGITNLTTILLSITILASIYSLRVKEIFKDKFIIYLLIFFLYIFINSIINFHSFEIVLKSLGNFRYILISVGVYLVLSIITEKQKEKIVNLNLILILIICFDIIYQYIFYKDLLGFLPGICPSGIAQGCQRFSGPFGDELVAGGYLSQIGLLFLFLHRSINLKEKIYKISLINIYLLALFLVIIITGERNALLIYLIAISFIFLFQKKLFHLILILLFLLTTLFIASQIFSSVNKRFSSITKIINQVDVDKEDIYLQETNLNFFQKIKKSPWGIHYQAAFELFEDNIIFGQGPKSFRIKCGTTEIEKIQVKKEKQDGKGSHYFACSSHPHNYLLEFLSENGILGGLFYVGFILLIVMRIIKKRKNKIANDVLKSIALGSLILAITFPLKPSGSFFTTFNASILFYIVGYFLYFSRENK